MTSQTIFLTAGATSKSVDISLVQNAGATSPGDPITGLAYNTSGLKAYYRAGQTGTLTAITLATQTVTGAYSSGGFVEISSTNAPGGYRLDIPDAVIASSGEANIWISGAANLETHQIKIIVTAINFYDSVRAGLTAMPNANAGTAGGIITSGTGTAQLSVSSGLVSLAAAQTTNITGNLSGSVGSVTGAVGSVTGNVGGNVAGSVGSVTAAVTVGTNNDKTGYTLSNAGIDALFTRQITESYAADGVAPTVAQALYLIQQTIGDFSISGTTLTVKQLNGSSTAAVYTLDSSTAPTSRTRTS